MRNQSVKFHSKQKGTVGEVSVARNLLSKGYSVFSEIGDLSRVDLVTIIDGVPIKLQVKSTSTRNGAVEIHCRKSGPGYTYRYTEADVDVFAVYVLDKEVVLYVSAKELLANKKSLKLRFQATRNGQKSKVRDAWRYTTFEDALRDHTPRALPVKGGYDMIQTTKEEIPASES